MRNNKNEYNLGNLICFSKQLNATVVLQYVSVPRGHLPGQYREKSARGQKRAGLDLDQKWPSCVGLSIRNGSLLKEGSERI